MPSRAVPSGDRSNGPFMDVLPGSGLESLELVLVLQDVGPARPLEIHTRRPGVLPPQTAQEHIEQAAERLLVRGFRIDRERLHQRQRVQLDLELIVIVDVLDRSSLARTRKNVALPVGEVDPALVLDDQVDESLDKPALDDQLARLELRERRVDILRKREQEFHLARDVLALAQPRDRPLLTERDLDGEGVDRSCLRLAAMLPVDPIAVHGRVDDVSDFLALPPVVEDRRLDQANRRGSSPGSRGASFRSLFRRAARHRPA